MLVIPNTIGFFTIRQSKQKSPQESCHLYDKSWVNNVFQNIYIIYRYIYIFQSYYRIRQSNGILLRNVWVIWHFLSFPSIMFFPEIMKFPNVYIFINRWECEIITQFHDFYYLLFIFAEPGLLLKQHCTIRCVGTICSYTQFVQRKNKWRLIKNHIVSSANICDNI